MAVRTRCTVTVNAQPALTFDLVESHMKVTEIQNWTEIQGVLVAGKYPLVEFVGQENEWALFRTIAANETFNLRVRFLEGAESLPQWRMLQSVPHSQLVEIIDAGHFQLHGAVLEYAVLEHWEDTLASVMGERELSGNEASEMLESIVPALVHLHTLHLVHGKVDPARIVATGNKIKLDFLDLQIELTHGKTAADDIAALGATLRRCLTGTGTQSAAFAGLPEPFADIVNRCLQPAAADRPTGRQVLDLLHGEYMEPLAESPADAETALPTVPRAPILRIVSALAALSLLVSVLVLHRPIAGTYVAPVRGTSAQSALPRSAAADKTYTRPSEAPAGERVWRVVAFTFPQSKEARKKADRINAKWPEARAEVFSAVPGKAPFLVAIGGRMTSSAATVFRRKAMAHGMPRDTYTQNFNH